jgi:Lon protease-like protein
MGKPPHGEVEDSVNRTRLADGLIEQASKGSLADVARFLALNIGRYHQRLEATCRRRIRSAWSGRRPWAKTANVRWCT